MAGLPGLLGAHRRPGLLPCFNPCIRHNGFMKTRDAGQLIRD
ncbi:hypothetical protein BDA96_10G232000 [Sorghum bicolor]|uniref:Uncharacterized protein n=2 Tax=Sorghum bicolor TaxID=4558 RepID=A0A921U1N1_SORBI|nr:hypothetical protein BDA96_10G232000 [Sorghum bicolor]OQU76626.1 hypothetical protein SORBI_3010G176101 [Sorghum bicolor]